MRGLIGALKAGLKSIRNELTEQLRLQNEGTNLRNDLQRVEDRNMPPDFEMRVEKLRSKLDQREETSRMEHSTDFHIFTKVLPSPPQTQTNTL